MNKTELINVITGRIEGASKKQTTEYLDTLIDTITETLATGEEVNLVGFLKLSVVDTPAREARNPQTGESVPVAAGRKVKVKALKNLKELFK
jgi:DNA-binding protein HU-beta